MDLFENIVENILCEISANDAYEKFYSKIPKETFDKIVNAYGGKFDGFIKLLLSGILDGSLTNINNILYCIKEYKALENKVRIYISNKIKNKEYSDAIELFYEIRNAVEGKIQIVSPKELYTNGLVNVAENETWKITCTLNYQASHHFYGNSKWCTASDRFGRYDGFEFFSKYITDLMGEWDDDEWDEPDVKAKCCLVQFVNKQDISKTMQAQIKSNGILETICNFADDEVYEEDFNSIFEKQSNMKIFIELQKQVKNLVKLTNEQREIELKYESSRNDYVYAKREEARKIREAAFLQKSDEAERLNNEQHNEVIRCFNEIIENKLFLNVDFLNSLYFTDDEIFETIDDLEEQMYSGINISETEDFKRIYKIIKDSKFLMKHSIHKLSQLSDYSILRLETVEGLEYVALDTDQPKVVVKVSTDRCYSKENGYIYILVKSEDGSNIDSIIKVVSRGQSDTIPKILPLRVAFDDLDDRFNDYILYGVWNEEENDTSYKIISLTNNKSVNLGTSIRYNETYLFKDSKEFILKDYNFLHHINLDTYKYEKIKNYKQSEFGSNIVYITQDATIFYTVDEKSMYIIKNEDFKNKNISADSIEYLNYGIFKVFGDKKIYIYTLPNLKEPIFECKSLFSIDDKTIVFYPLIDSRPIKRVIYKRKGNYFCYCSNSGEFITCDMYGNDINQSPSVNESFKKMKELYNKIID